jgi:hypothetical protein
LKIEKSALAAALRRASHIRPERVNVFARGDNSITVNAQEKGHGGLVSQETINALETDGVQFQALYGHFRSMIDAMPDGTITIDETGADEITVKNGRTRLKTRVISNPAIDELSSDGVCKAITLAGQPLRKAIAQTSHAMAQKDVRAYMNALHMRISQGRAEAVATDGFRMMISRFAVEHDGPSVDLSIINTAVPTLAAMAEENDVTVYMHEKTTVFQSGNWVCRLPIMEPFTGWTRVLAAIQPQGGEAISDLPPLLASMQRMLVAHEGSEFNAKQPCLVRVSGASDVLTLSLVGNDSADAIDTEGMSRDMEFGIDARQVADALEAAKVAKVRLHYSPPVSSMSGSGRLVLLPESTSDLTKSAFLAMIMEHRI